MVRAPNQGAAPVLLAGKERHAAPGQPRAPVRITGQCRRCAILDLRLRGAGLLGSEARYLAPVALAYLRRNLSTRPAVSTIFCLPV